MMPVYEYECESCGHVYEKERRIAERHHPGRCECGADENLQTIVIQSTQFTMVKTPRLMSMAQTESEYGKDWRETPGSRRIKAGEPERIYGFSGKNAAASTK